MTNFLFLGSKITVHGDRSLEIIRQLFLGRKAIVNLDSVLKSKDITLPTKVHIIKTVVFPVVMYRSDSWTIKNVEHWRIDASNCDFESPLGSKKIKLINLKGNQPWILFGRTDAEAEVPVLWPFDVNSWLFGKDPDAGKDWEKVGKGWDGWMALPIQYTWTWANSRRWWGTRKPGVLKSMGSQRIRHNFMTEQPWIYVDWFCIWNFIIFIY